MINTSGVHPPSRSRHIMGLDTKSSKIYIFGGNGDTAGSYLDDLWEYDIKKNTWSRIPPKGNFYFNFLINLFYSKKIKKNKKKKLKKKLK